MVHYELEIGWSRSARFAEVAAFAVGLPGAVRSGSGTGVRIRVPIRAAALTDVAQMLALAAGWRHSRLRVDGQPLPRPALHQLAAVAACAQTAALAAPPAVHCWGLSEGVARRLPCRFLDPLLPWEPDGLPLPVREAALAAAARARGVASCPFYDASAIATACQRWLAGRDPCQEAFTQAAASDRTALARLLADIDWDGP